MREDDPAYIFAKLNLSIQSFYHFDSFALLCDEKEKSIDLMFEIFGFFNDLLYLTEYEFKTTSLMTLTEMLSKKIK